MKESQRLKAQIKVYRQIVKNRDSTIIKLEKTISDLRKMLRKMETLQLEIKEGLI